MVGRATIPSGESHAFLRPSDGPVTDIDTNRPGQATGINDTGWVAGNFNVSNAWRAFRRDPFNGGIQDLGFVSDGSALTNPSFALRGSIGREINNAGQVVGYFTTGAVHAFRYTDEGEDGIYQDIGMFAGGLTLASGIDDTGTVVGGSWVPGSPETMVRLLGHGVMFRNEAEGLIDLNSINPASGWTLRHAFDIAGDFIVGTGELNERCDVPVATILRRDRGGEWRVAGPHVRQRCQSVRRRCGLGFLGRRAHAACRLRLQRSLRIQEAQRRC